MPVNVTDEMKAEVLTIIKNDEGIKRSNIIALSGRKEWYVAAALGELQNDKFIFRQTRGGQAYYYTDVYAKANNVPKTISSSGDNSGYIPPVKDKSLLDSQRYFNQLFQVAR